MFFEMNKDREKKSLQDMRSMNPKRLFEHGLVTVIGTVKHGQ